MDNDSSGIPPEESASGGKSGLAALVEDALVELARALKTVNFYPRGHPTLQITLDKTRNSLAMALSDRDQLALGISKDGFQLSSEPLVPGNQVLVGLAREFFLRQLKQVFFLKGLSVQELENFLRVMAMEVELFRGKGKVEEYLTDGGVIHICANEIRLGQSLGIQRKQEAPREAVPMDDRLQELISSLQTETDPKKYLALAREASVMAMRFIDEGKIEAAFMIMRTFCEAFSGEPARAPMIIEAAKSGFKELSIGPMIEHMLRQITLLDGSRRQEVLDVAFAMGGKLVENMLDKLATNEALYSHRALIQVLLSKSELSREPIEARLSDDRWWVVRKSAFLLGEIADNASVPLLMDALSHADTRVQKELLKAMAKIGGPEATKKLLDVIGSKMPLELRLHSIRLLGAARERSAVPTLVKILKNRGSFLDNTELLEESTRALGKIGSTQAVPVLSELLLKRSVFARAKSINLGVDAAESLGAIGGKEAEEVLKKGAENKHAEIRLACLKILKADRKNANRAAKQNNQGE